MPDGSPKCNRIATAVVVVVVVEVREASASLCATEESLPSERDHLARFLCQVREFDVNVSEYSHSCFCCSVAH